MAAPWQPLFTTAGGTVYWFRDNGDDTFTVSSFQEVDPFLDRNKALATLDDGYSPTRELRRLASIPLNLISKWEAEEGWNALHPHYHDKLTQRLNDIDYQHLRTAPGRV